MKSFDEIFVDKTKYGVKVQTSEYGELGKHIIIDQGQTKIAGYTDREEGIFDEVPVVIFGDHTRVIKYVDEPFFLGADGVKVLRSKDENANYKYLYYALKNAKLPNTGYNRHFKWLKEVQIYYPDRNKQAKIVKILDKVSCVIEKRKDELSVLDNLIKARFVEMFGDLMLNSYEWPVVKISDISTFLKSGLSRKLSDDDIGLPVIRSGNIQNGQFVYSDVKYWYKDDPQGSNTKDYVLEEGDVLVNFINSASQIGKTAIFRDTGRECIYTTNIFRMKLTDNCNEYYYNWFAMSDYYYRQLQNIIQPAVNQASFTTVNFLKLNVPLPPIELQNEFADFVHKVDKSKVAVQKALDETQMLFDSLMQKYFG